jgi:Sec-independent protein secretion pathway component TatC
VFSMLLMLIPLYGLYELGILLVATLPADRVARGRRGSDGDEE